MFNHDNKPPNAILDKPAQWFIGICKIFDLRLKKWRGFWSCFLSFFYIEHSVQLPKGGWVSKNLQSTNRLCIFRVFILMLAIISVNMCFVLVRVHKHTLEQSWPTPALPEVHPDSSYSRFGTVKFKHYQNRFQPDQKCHDFHLIQQCSYPCKFTLIPIAKIWPCSYSPRDGQQNFGFSFFMTI